MEKNCGIKRLIDVKWYLYKRSAGKSNPNDLMSSFKKIHYGSLNMEILQSEIEDHIDKKTIKKQLTSEKKNSSQDDEISEYRLSFEVPSVKKAKTGDPPVRSVKVSWENINIELNVTGGELPFSFRYRTQPMFFCHPEYNVDVFCNITYLDSSAEPSILKRIGNYFCKLANINPFRSNEKKKMI